MRKSYKGIDISLYQGKPDFAAVRKSGVDFVMLKASQGRTAEYDAPFSDPEFEYNIAAVSRLFHEGLYAGAYHYLCARTVAEAKAEADYFIALVGKHRYRVRLWAAVDVEDGGFLPQDKELLSKIVAVFCDKVKQAGLRPMVYANTWWLDNRFTPPEGVPVWEANWSAASFPDRARMWQYSASGEVGGISGAVDMNIAFDIIGDANGDGKVDMKDVSAVVRHAAGWKVSLDEIQADLDGDGFVTLKDAAKLIRLISGR